MADYVMAPVLFKRVQYTGDPVTFLADLQAETNGVWNWAVFPADNDVVLVRFSSNSVPPTYLEVGENQFLIFRDGHELPYLDNDGSSVVPA